MTVRILDSSVAARAAELAAASGAARFFPPLSLDGFFADEIMRRLARAFPGDDPAACS